MKRLRILFLSIAIVLAFSFNVKAEFFSDIIASGPNGIWTDSRAYSSLNAAITAVGANQRTVKVVSPQVVTSLTVPANVTLEFERDGSITNSDQLTINTKNIVADNRQIFTGVGNIDFASGSIIKTGWFSNIETAFALTSNDTITLIVSKPQTITTSYSPGSDVSLQWEAPGNILTVNGGVTVSNIGQVIAGNYQLFAGAGNFRFRDGTNLNSSWFSNLRSIITWVSTNRVTLTSQGTLLVDFTDTVPTNIHIDVDTQRGLLSVSGGVTLTINSNIQAGPYQWFSGAGSVVLTSVEKHYPEWYSSGTYTQATIEAALTAIGTTNKATLLLRPGTWVISSNANWSAYTNVTFKIEPGAVISHGAFTVNIPNLDASLYQIFSGTGLVTLSGNVKEAYPDWYTTNASPGVTNMTTAIQAALNSSAKAVNIFNTYAATRVYANAAIRIYGKGTLARLSASSTPLLDITVSNIEVEGVTFNDIAVNSNAGARDQNNIGVSAYGTSSAVPITNITIKNCKFNGFRGDGISLGFVENARIIENDIRYIGYAGIYCISLIDSVISENGIYYVDSPTTTDEDRYGITLSRYANATLANSAKCTNVMVTDNIIFSVPRWSGIDNHASANIVIKGNRVSGCPSGIYVQYDSLVEANRSYASDIIITGNTVEGIATAANSKIGIGSLGDPTQLNERVIVTDNIVKGNFLTGSLYFNNTKYGEIKNNIVEKAYGCGLTVQGGNDIEVSGNIINGVKDPTADIGWYFRVTPNISTKVRFDGNRAFNATGDATYSPTAGILYAATGTGVVFSKNRILNASYHTYDLSDNDTNIYADLSWEFESETIKFNKTLSGGSAVESMGDYTASFRRLPAGLIFPSVTFSTEAATVLYGVSILVSNNYTPIAFKYDGTNTAAVTLNNIIFTLRGIFFGD